MWLAGLGGLSLLPVVLVFPFQFCGSESQPPPETPVFKMQIPKQADVAPWPKSWLALWVSGVLTSVHLPRCF